MGDAAVEPLSIMAWLSSRVHILRRQIYRPNHFAEGEQAQAQVRDAAQRPYRRELEKLDAMIAEGHLKAPALRAYALVFALWAMIDHHDRLPHLEALATDLMEHPGVAAAVALHCVEHHRPK